MYKIFILNITTVVNLDEKKISEMRAYFPNVC